MSGVSGDPEREWLTSNEAKFDATWGTTWGTKVERYVTDNVWVGNVRFSTIVVVVAVMQ